MKRTKTKIHPVVARQSHMQLYAHNLGILGGMAQGKMDYDADAAARCRQQSERVG